jgi:hypothetical protein
MPSFSPSRMPLYALNLFDLADNDLYRQSSRRTLLPAWWRML